MALQRQNQDRRAEVALAVDMGSPCLLIMLGPISLMLLKGGTQGHGGHLRAHPQIRCPPSCDQPSQTHLPGVVETFSLDVISLFIHHLHLGVQFPAQVLETVDQKRAETQSPHPGPLGL